jgi:hypothetical protein
MTTKDEWVSEYDGADKEARELAQRRNASHGGHPGNCSTPGDPLAPHVKGAMGELAFARAFGLPVGAVHASGGDDGVDFHVRLHCGGNIVADILVDVKTTERTPPELMVKREHLQKNKTHIYVLAILRDGVPTLVGWETRFVVALMPIRKYGANEVHCRAADQLRPMDQLVNLFAMRQTEIEK